MNLLLDTHILIWLLMDDERLSKEAREMIIKNDVFFSSISTLEIELKNIAHPNTISISTKEFHNELVKAGLKELPLLNNHIYALSELKKLDNHKDPFDRLLITQASVENMLFLTHDKLLSQYEKPCIINV